MLNTFLTMVLLFTLLLVEWSARSVPDHCRPQARRVQAWWQAHALFSVWLLWFNGLAWLEQQWLNTLWPEAWMGLAIVLCAMLIHFLLQKLWFRLYRLHANTNTALLLSLASLLCLLLAYGPEQPIPALFYLVGMLLGFYCGRNLASRLLRVTLFWLAAAVVQFFLQWPETAMHLAHTLPGHYNSLLLSLVLLPWLFAPLWLLPALLAGQVPVGFCKPFPLCYRRPQDEHPYALTSTDG